MPRTIVGVLLAAGAGSRFGGGKLLYPLADGTPMGVAAAANLKSACPDSVAVLRPHDDELADLLIAAGCEIVFCSEAYQGIGHSLAAGVRATADASAWIIALADMPFVASASHRAVLSCLRTGAKLAATEYCGRRGHPVGFSRVLGNQLMAMTGDRGGQSILDLHREELMLCPVDDAGVVRDIDTRDDDILRETPAVFAADNAVLLRTGLGAEADSL